MLTFKDCENKEVRKAVTGIMWEVKMKDKHMEAMAETVRGEPTIFRAQLLNNIISKYLHSTYMHFNFLFF